LTKGFFLVGKEKPTSPKIFLFCPMAIWFTPKAVELFEIWTTCQGNLLLFSSFFGLILKTIWPSFKKNP